jgi:peptidoglycan/xylan/chitin deacetylase (PgdA/CDA1 family)
MAAGILLSRTASFKPSWLRALLLVASLIALLAPASVSAKATRVVATDVVNVRACPALSCDVIGQASLDDPLEVNGEVVEGFLPVQWEGLQGYVYSLFSNHDGVAPWFTEGPGDCQRVAIIFDIGVGYPPSERIVQTLLAYGADATMFPMGQWALDNPDFLRELASYGFPIGTHGHGAVTLPDLADSAIEYDLRTSIEAIESVIDQPIDPFFTPYAADTSERVRQVAASMGLLPVGWHVAAADYGPDATASSVYHQVMDNVYPGAVIEMHLDGPATEESTADALPQIIEDLWVAGYELVTIPELVNPC